MAEENRRSFLKWAIYGLSAVFTAVLGFPAVAYLIDPRHRAANKSAFRRVDAPDLKEIGVNEPVQGVIRDIRRDAWVLHPTDVIGRVWIVKRKDVARPDPGKIADPDLLVFTTVCPHLGCSVNLKTDGAEVLGFACPCHNGQFQVDGNRVDEVGVSNPAPRGMDTLEWQLDPLNENKLLVKYLNFRQLESEKIVKT